MPHRVITELKQHSINLLQIILAESINSSRPHNVTHTGLDCCTYKLG